MTKTEAATCQTILNYALDETWASERRGDQYVVCLSPETLSTPQEVGLYIQDHIDNVYNDANADACDLGIGCY